MDRQMNPTQTAENLIAEMTAAKEVNIYTDPNIPLSDRQAALLGRIGAFTDAILKIKIAFDLPLIEA